MEEPLDSETENDIFETSIESVGEDSELEISCALHQLTTKVQAFQAKMQTEDEEISEDIDEKSSPKKSLKSQFKDFKNSSWNEKDKVEELHEMQDHIAMLISGLKKEVNVYSDSKE